MLFTFISLLPTAGKRLTTAKYVFFIGAAIKIAVSFSEFQCLCADLAVVRFCTFCFEGLLIIKQPTNEICNDFDLLFISR